MRKIKSRSIENVCIA